MVALVKDTQIIFSQLGGGGALALQKPPKRNAFERRLPRSGCACHPVGSSNSKRRPSVGLFGGGGRPAPSDAN